MKTFDLAGFAAHLAKLGVEMAATEHEALDRAARIVKAEAKASIGEYQAASGPFPAWPPLAPSTVEEKERLGYAPPDNPLLREGSLRNSIEHTVGLKEASVGSNSDVAVWQELGTSRIPPRSFLGGAAARKVGEVVDVIAGSIVSELAGQAVPQRVKIT